MPHLVSGMLPEELRQPVDDEAVSLSVISSSFIHQFIVTAWHGARLFLGQ